jgi:hypothetical protein
VRVHRTLQCGLHKAQKLGASKKGTIFHKKVFGKASFGCFCRIYFQFLCNYLWVHTVCGVDLEACFAPGLLHANKIGLHESSPLFRVPPLYTIKLLLFPIFIRESHN